MQEIRSLEPGVVWQYFDEILKIPRPSKKEEKIIEYLRQFAEKNKLSYRLDTVGNLLISKPATAGYENLPVVILQGHVDMVCEKNADVVHDFEKDPIKARIDNGWVTATGTTLGADDSIGLAAAMAVLASDDLPHGPLECFFTVDEESGMTGALALQPGFLKGRILLNLDSEDEGELFIGCAGGMDTIARFQIRKKRIPRTQKALRIFVGGLKGGHSGDEIHKGLGNSNKILNRFLWNADQRFDIRLAQIDGGNLRNAIPREASAIIVMENEVSELLRVYFDSFFSMIRKELASVEPDFFMELTETALPEFAFRKKFQRKFFQAIYAVPHGVISWSQDIHGLVETSTNLASVKMKDGDLIEVVTSQRSSVESAKRDISDRIEALFTLAGAEVIHSDGYPGWKPDPESRILAVTRSAYTSLFGKDPAVRAIHAGLECGLFLEKYPDLDMVSFGPTIKGAHSPDERIEIESVKKFWDLLLRTLASIPPK